MLKISKLNYNYTMSTMQLIDLQQILLDYLL